MARYRSTSWVQYQLGANESKISLVRGARPSAAAHAATSKLYMPFHILLWIAAAREKRGFAGSAPNLNPPQTFKVQTGTAFYGAHGSVGGFGVRSLSTDPRRTAPKKYGCPGPWPGSARAGCAQKLGCEKRSAFLTWLRGSTLKYVINA